MYEPFPISNCPKHHCRARFNTRAKNVLSQHQYHKVLLVTDAGMLQHKLHLPILTILDQLGLDFVIYSDIQADPLNISC